MACTEHRITKGREGLSGSWCVECGEKVYEVEHRKCGTCANFKDILFPICRKFTMTVTKEMYVTYKIQDGSCYE